MVIETEFLLKTKDYSVTVTNGGNLVITIVDEKDDFTGEVIKNIYFRDR